MEDTGNDTTLNGAHDKHMLFGSQGVSADTESLTTPGNKHELFISNMPGPPEALQAMGTNGSGKFDQICSAFYHYGECLKLSSGRECRFKHDLDDSLRVSKVPPWAHKYACDLPRCPWKDGSASKVSKRVTLGPCATGGMKVDNDGQQMDAPSLSKKRKRQSTGRADSVHDKVSERLPKTKVTCPYRHPAITEDQLNGKSLLRPAPPPTSEEIGEWKNNVRHWDQPKQDFGCYGIDYDDHSAASSPEPDAKRRRDHIGEGDEKATAVCFFWYHGSCGRAKDSRTGYKCTHRHSLNDDEPEYVQPPPGYKHRAPCGLEWCPGDAKEKEPATITDETLIIDTEDLSD